jgi:hypothetical protein
MTTELTIGKRINRMPRNSLTEDELRMLSRIELATYMRQAIGNNEEDRKQNALLLSLERFGLVDYVELLNDGRYAGFVHALSEEGQAKLNASRPIGRYACCKHTIQLACVCAARTYCPNPYHRESNGCHGSHD